jgi:hypothetical protein
MVDTSGLESKGLLLTWFNSISGSYFQTVGERLIAGRDFGRRDNTSAPGVAIVNEEFCRKFLAGGNPLGRQVRMVIGAGDQPHKYQNCGLGENSQISGPARRPQSIGFCRREPAGRTTRRNRVAGAVGSDSAE